MSGQEQGLEAHGLTGLKAVHRNLGTSTLYEMAIARGEGRLAQGGPLVVLTGQHTGRSASDKFIVKDATTDTPSGGTTTKRSRPKPSRRCTPT